MLRAVSPRGKGDPSQSAYCNLKKEPTKMGEFDVTAMLTAMCRAAERRDGQAFASYFAYDGVYQDDFY